MLMIDSTAGRQARQMILMRLQADRYGGWGALPGDVLEGIVQRVCDEYHEALFSELREDDRMHEDCVDIDVYHEAQDELERLKLKVAKSTELFRDAVKALRP